MPRAILALSDGKVFEGTSFGFEGEAQGEIVFNTSITGYQEILTDPSYCNQIVILTNPMIGNYGVNENDVESCKVQAAGLIVREYSKVYSNAGASESLGDWLKRNRVAAGEGFPTRAIVKHIREQGAQPAILSTLDLEARSLVKRAKALPSMVGQNLVPKVSCQKPYHFCTTGQSGNLKIVVYDFGVKQNILRMLARDFGQILVAPVDTPHEQVFDWGPDAIVLSNGPGDPAAMKNVAANIGHFVDHYPILAICLGHQILARHFGAKTYKLKFGHRGANHPVKHLATGKILITSQNHGFAVDQEGIPKELVVTQINLNDGTVEGFRHNLLPILALQYHPEASPGPHDARDAFEFFYEWVKDAKAKRTPKSASHRVWSNPDWAGLRV